MDMSGKLWFIPERGQKRPGARYAPEKSNNQGGPRRTEKRTCALVFPRSYVKTHIDYLQNDSARTFVLALLFIFKIELFVSKADVDHILFSEESSGNRGKHLSGVAHGHGPDAHLAVAQPPHGAALGIKCLSLELDIQQGLW